MDNDANAVFERVCEHARETALLAAVESTLGWDERTMLPEAAGPYRAEQVTLLSGMIHDRQTDPQLGQWLEELSEGPLVADPSSDAGTTIRRLKRRYDKRVKLPKRLVEELTRTAALSEHAWQKARKRGDFPTMQPWLEKIFQLKREEADALGYEQRRYDALLDDYEPEARTSHVAETLSGLREQLVPLVEAIQKCGRKPDTSILTRKYPVALQEQLGRMAARQIGFDFERGRLDVTAHPFCTELGPDDCRIATRYSESFFNEALFGILHEAGHGIYDQGLRTDQYGLPPGDSVSLGIHESQSRLWENLVGRSRAFWEWLYPEAQRCFPEALGDVGLDAFYYAINAVEPSLIRVEADEATYNLHILIRFELEQAVLDEELAVGDLPGAWKEKYRKYLGVEPRDDGEGVLQDIHWSAGLIGYFPTYALGNLCAAQFFAAADRALGGLSESFARGDFGPLREWLRENIHRQGQRYNAEELVERVTGEPLSHGPLMSHLRGKLEPLYGLA